MNCYNFSVLEFEGMQVLISVKVDFLGIPSKKKAMLVIFSIQQDTPVFVKGASSGTLRR